MYVQIVVPYRIIQIRPMRDRSTERDIERVPDEKTLDLHQEVNAIKCPLCHVHAVALPDPVWPPRQSTEINF